jgi:hypothetical protein
MPNEWFIRNANEVKGPLSDQQVKQLAALGQITPVTHIRLGVGAWAMASSVRGLFPPPPQPDPSVDDFGFDALIENAIRDDEGSPRSNPAVAVPETATKICPFCSEEIKASAVKCKHCGEFLSERPAHHSASRTATAVSPPQRSSVSAGPERTLWEAKPGYASYFAVWLGVAWSWTLCCLVIFIVMKSGSMGQLFLVGLGLFVFGAVLFTWAFLHRNTTKYRRTTKRVVCEWGIVSGQSSEVRLSDITAMNLKQSAIDALFGIGNIELCTSGTSGVEVYLRAVPDPKQVREEIRQARDLFEGRN